MRVLFVILRKFFELGQSVLSNVYFQALFISLFKNLNEDNANKHILSSEITYFKLELFSISYDRGDWYGHNYFFCVFCRKTALKMSKWVTVPLTVPEIKRQRVVPSDIVSVIFLMLCCLLLCEIQFYPPLPSIFQLNLFTVLGFSETHYRWVNFYRDEFCTFHCAITDNAILIECNFIACKPWIIFC